MISILQKEIRSFNCIIFSYFIFLSFFISRNVKGQTLDEKLLMSDSAGIALKNAIDKLDIKYGFNYHKNSDSTIRVLNDLVEKRAKRYFLIEKYTIEAEKKNWISKTDSIIKLNKTDFKGTGNIGVGLSTNQGMFSVNYAFVFSKYRKFDFGFGTGVEYLNRSQGLVQVIQSPAFITNKYFVTKGTFLNIDYGLTIPLSANYKNQNDATIDLKESELKSNYFINFGLGFITKTDYCVQINFRNNSLGVPEPLNQRVWMFGVKLGF